MPKKKIVKTMSPRFGYKVDIQRYCDDSQQAEEEYGSWYAIYTNTLSTVVEKVTKYPDITSPLDIPVGGNALVVWAEWSTGDSFGTGTNAHAEAIGIFRDLESAKVLQKGLERAGDDGYSIRTPDGQVFEASYTAWRGYFESLTAIHITNVGIY